MKLKIKLSSFLMVTLVVFSSCFKEDEIVVPQKPGNVETVVVEMLPDYSVQSYFSLAEGEIVSSNDRVDWDIALSCQPDDYTLWLNTSIFMYAARTGIFDFSLPVSPEGMELKFDESNGDIAGNAIGKWWISDLQGLRESGEVLLIDRGIDSEGFSRGYLKIQPLIDPVSFEVSIRVANPDGTGQRTFAMPRDPLRRFVTLSFDNGFNNPQIEPPANNWDLHFTTYTTLLFTNTGEPYPYLVNGVLLNDTLVFAALDSITPFASIDRAKAESYTFSSQRDLIGYDWKEINGDVTSGNITYTARSEWTYIILDRNGVYFKMRFIDFYNNQGKKGYPTIEFQRL
jgi:hypothetical protein